MNIVTDANLETFIKATLEDRDRILTELTSSLANAPTYEKRINLRAFKLKCMYIYSNIEYETEESKLYYTASRLFHMRTILAECLATNFYVSPFYKASLYYASGFLSLRKALIQERMALIKDELLGRV